MFQLKAFVQKSGVVVREADPMKLASDSSLDRVVLRGGVRKTGD
jgi:hypothetical protein